MEMIKGFSLEAFICHKQLTWGLRICMFYSAQAQLSQISDKCRGFGDWPGARRTKQGHNGGLGCACERAVEAAQGSQTPRVNHRKSLWAHSPTEALHGHSRVQQPQGTNPSTLSATAELYCIRSRGEKILLGINMQPSPPVIFFKLQTRILNRLTWKAKARWKSHHGWEKSQPQLRRKAKI